MCWLWDIHLDMLDGAAVGKDDSTLVAMTFLLIGRPSCGQWGMHI
jgi:hypothetical protein